MTFRCRQVVLFRLQCTLSKNHYSLVIHAVSTKVRTNQPCRPCSYLRHEQSSCLVEGVPPSRHHVSRLGRVNCASVAYAGVSDMLGHRYRRPDTGRSSCSWPDVFSSGPTRAKSLERSRHSLSTSIKHNGHGYHVDISATQRRRGTRTARNGRASASNGRELHEHPGSTSRDVSPARQSSLLR